MTIKLKNTKIIIMGIQGSGKTELAKKLTRAFKKPMAYIMHKDDMAHVPKHTAIIEADAKTIEELDTVCANVILLGKKGKVDALFIDEADMFLNGNIVLPRNINDLVINHRHYGLSVVLITRRPQDIPTKIVESCEHKFIFALPNSDNIERKMKTLDKEIPQLQTELSKDNHKFIHVKLGEKPKLMQPIKLERGNKNNGKAKKDGTVTDL